MTNKKSKILKISAFLGAIVIGAMLLLMPFMVNNKKSSVYADDFSDFSSFNSSFITALTSASNTPAGSVNRVVVIRSSLYSDTSGNRSIFLKIGGSPDYWVTGGVEGISDIVFDVPVGFNALSYTGVSNLNFDNIQNNDLPFVNNSDSFADSGSVSPYFKLKFTFNSTSNSTLYLPFSVHFNNSQTDYVSFVKVECAQFFGVPVGLNISYNVPVSLGSYSMFCVKYDYFDKDGNHFSYCLPLSYYADTLTTSDMTYYFINPNDFSDNDYYIQGRYDGLQIGRSEGDAVGYQRGYDDGYSVGERTGFNQGLQDANTYSFLGLFGAIVDAPLQAFTGLFDFNLSFDGVHNFNLKGFFLAILSIAIVVAIIRFAMSR